MKFISSLFDSFLSPVLGKDKTFWMPEQASTYAYEIDYMFSAILWISTLFFVLIVLFMCYFAWKYRRREEGELSQPSPSHNTTLEITWTVIPIIIVIWMFWKGFTGYMDMMTPPQNGYEINVIGQTWQWNFEYPNGYIDEELHCWKDEPIIVTITSMDVLHSVFIPAFRFKMDAVPGRYHRVWFEPTKAGEFDLYCAEYCGTGHSDMRATVVVHEGQAEFEEWLAEASNFLCKMPPHEAGKKMFEGVGGCKACHSIDGTRITGPSMKDVYGTEETLKDGSKVTVDDNYIRDSLLDPQSQVVAGYDPVMPTFKGRFSDGEISAIIAYIKSLKEGWVEPEWEYPPECAEDGEEGAVEKEDTSL